MQQPLVVYITVPSEEVGLEIAHALVEQRLAACVSLAGPVTSVYRWQGKINEDIEVLLIAKTRAERFEEVFVPAVQALHPYDVPEIIALPVVAGAQNYLDWIDANVQPRE